MEVSRECRDCKERWDGGLNDEQCPKCKSVKCRITWTDESNDYHGSRYEDDYEDEGGEDEDN
jgi:hypothetical protein